MEEYEYNNELDENKLNQPLATYQSLPVSQDIPEYILENIQMSLDEYKKGKYRSVENFMKKYL